MEGAAGPASTPVRPPLLVLGALAVCALAIFGSDGPAGVPLRVALPVFGLAAAAIGLALVGRLPVARLDRPGRLTVAAASVLCLWTCVSLVWSIAPDRSWLWFGRGLVLLGFLVVGLIVGATAHRLVWLAAGMAVVLGGALWWALAGLAVPRLAPDGDRVARLQEPVGYWNALALLAGAALGFSLWALAAPRRFVRLGGAVLAFSAVVVVLATQSRAGLVAAVIVVSLGLARAPRRLEAGLRLLLATAPGVAVGAWVFTQPALVDDGAGRAARLDVAPTAAAVVLAGLVVSGALVAVVPAERLVIEHARALTRLLAGSVAMLVVVGAVALVFTVGNPLAWVGDQIGTAECVNSPDRLTSFCDNNRLAWWGDALEIARDQPVLGTGAGTFEIARLRVRNDGSPVTQPHSVPFQLLADLGLVGLGLGLLGAVSGVVAVRRAVARRTPESHGAVVALSALPLAWSVHALVDFDLDFVAVSGPVFLALGALLASGRPTRSLRAGVPGVAVASAVAVAACGAVVLPALAQRAVEEALTAEDLETAAAAARRARALDPLSLDPVFAQAVIAGAAGDPAREQELLELATRKQPENPRPWITLGYFHYLDDPPRYCAAYQAFDAAYTLDQRSSRWVPGGPLDVARAAVNAGACETEEPVSR